jgi:hypothetical protein
VCAGYLVERECSGKSGNKRFCFEADVNDEVELEEQLDLTAKKIDAKIEDGCFVLCNHVAVRFAADVEDVGTVVTRIRAAKRAKPRCSLF